MVKVTIINKKNRGRCQRKEKRKWKEKIKGKERREERREERRQEGRREGGRGEKKGRKEEERNKGQGASTQQPHRAAAKFKRLFSEGPLEGSQAPCS